MNIAMRLTLDGLVRALRMKAHALAEEIEAGYRRDDPAQEDGLKADRGTTRDREADDGRAGR